MINPYESPPEVEEQQLAAHPPSPQSMSKCMLCGDTELEESRQMYGHLLCFECATAFTRRRHGAYLVDLCMFWLTAYLGFFGVAVVSQFFREPLTYFLIGSSVVYVVCSLLFYLKDGFAGQSPGKRITGLTVVDQQSGKPIGFIQSLKRSTPLLLTQVTSTLVSLVSSPPSFFEKIIVCITIPLVTSIMLSTWFTIQVNWGKRWGDDIANTMVIWNRFRNHVVFRPSHTSEND